MAYKNFVEAYQNVIAYSGDNPSREGLRDTPVRSAKAMSFFTQGYQQTVADVVGDALFPSDNADMVIVKDIEFYSLCEHHLLPFFGKVHIAYLPKGQVLGLSKFARIADVFARRLQIQESLTLQIAQGIADITGASAVAVKIEASHMCMMMRGVQKQGAITVTQKMLGEFADNANLRQEFLSQL